MFSLFGRRLPIDESELEFQMATFKWLIAGLGDFGLCVQRLRNAGAEPAKRLSAGAVVRDD